MGAVGPTFFNGHLIAALHPKRTRMWRLIVPVSALLSTGGQDLWGCTYRPGTRSMDGEPYKLTRWLR